MPSNTTAGTAQDLGTFPWTPAYVEATGGVAELWFKFTAPAEADLPTVRGPVGFRISSNNNNHDFQIFSDAGITQWTPIANIEGQDQPFQMPVTPSAQYWIRAFSLITGGVTTVTLTAWNVPDEVVPAYALVVPDDVFEFPSTIFDGTSASGSVQTYGIFPASEAGDSLPSGHSLSYARATNSGIPTGDETGVELFRGRTSITTLTGLFTAGARHPMIRGNGGAGTFWVAQANALDTAITLKQISTAGAVLQTIGPVTLSPSTTIAGFAVDVGETIAYLSESANGGGIRRLDLASATFLSDLVAGTAGDTPEQDLIVLPDDTLLAPFFQLSSSTGVVRRYNAAGTLLNTYTTYALASDDSHNHLADAHDDGASFWDWLFSLDADGNPTGKFRRIRVSDGSTITEFSSYEFNLGQGPGSGTAPTTVQSGHSNSCPFWILRASSAPDPTPGELTGTTPAPCCCCDDGNNGDGSGATGPMLPAIDASWTAMCDGGGTVPTAADLTDAENWDD